MIKSLTAHFGGKRTLAPRIIAELGPHKSFHELFGGGMAVLMAKPESSSETVCELYGEVTNVAWIMQSEKGLELFDRCARTLVSEAIFDEAKEALRAPFQPGLERAYNFIVCAWMGLNGLCGMRRAQPVMNKRFTSSGGSPGARWVHVVESMPWWAQRLRRVVILNSCGISHCEKIDDQAGTVIYADPPYVGEGKDYIYPFTEVDHRTLAERLGRFKKARVVVSYYADPLVDELYEGWTRVEVQARKNLVTVGKNKSGVVKAPELLLINGPSRAQRDFFTVPNMCGRCEGTGSIGVTFATGEAAGEPCPDCSAA